MSLERASCRVGGVPLPLWERSERIEDAFRVRGLSPRTNPMIDYADRYPSSDADFVRATFSHKGRREGAQASRAAMLPQPRPTNGIFDAITVMVSTLASSGRVAM